MPEARAPAVWVIIVNWNGGDDLRVAVTSALGQSQPPARVLVLDNGSTDDSVASLDGVEAVEVVRLGQNLGFATANNRGIEAARGCHVLLLNPDAKLAPDFLARALPALAHDGVGFVAGKVLRFDGVTIDTCGQTLSPVLRKVIELGYGEIDRGQFDLPGEVPSVCGAVALYSASLLAVIAPGGRLFDDDFFAFWEDADVGARARRAGFRGFYEPAALAWHRRGGTRKRTGRLLGRTIQMLGREETIQYHIVKNRYLFLLRNEPLLGLLLRLPVFLLADGLLLATIAVLRPRLFRRLLAAWPLYRAAWRKRRQVTA